MAERRRRVALVTDAVHPYHRGGKEIRYHELARRLARDADVRVFTMRWWDGPRVRRQDGVTFEAIAPHLPLYASGERRSVLQAVVFALSCLRLLARSFDVLEADHMPYLQLFPLWLVARVRRRRLVVTWHESWGREGWEAYLGRAGRAGWWLERAAMRLPDAIIAASEETAARLRRHVGDRVPVTAAPNGVDLALVRDASPALAAADVVVVGRLLDHKRIDLLLDAIALLHGRGTPATCRIIGDGPQRDALRARAREAGIAHLVEFRHDVHGQRDLYAEVKAARVFAFPSAREGFGIAVLEALACGLPVVTTAAPDNLARHLVADSAGGVVCEPTAAGLADAIGVLLRDGHARTGWCDAYVERFGWDAVTENVKEVVLA